MEKSLVAYLFVRYKLLQNHVLMKLNKSHCFDIGRLYIAENYQMTTRFFWSN